MLSMSPKCSEVPLAYMQAVLSKMRHGQRTLNKDCYKYTLNSNL